MKKVIVSLCVVVFVAIRFEVTAGTVATPFLGVSTAFDSLQLVEFTGNYTFKENPLVKKISISIEKNELVTLDLETNDGYKLTANKDKADSFSIASIGAEVVFVRNEKRKVIGIKVVVGDDTIEGEKDK